jgi:hypothetical protein
MTENKLTRVKAIRKKCLMCSDGQADVRNCTFKDCQLYPYRMGKRPKVEGMTPQKAIREFCTECCNGNPKERKLCPATGCPTWGYRLRG